MRREDFIGKKRPVPVIQVTVPVFGEIYLRKLSALDRERSFDIPPGISKQARLAVMLVSDANGNRVFTDADAIEMGADSSLGDAILAVCELGNKFHDLDTDAAKKNSETTQPES